MKRLAFKLDYQKPYSLHYHAVDGEVVRSFWLHGKPIVMRLTQKKPDSAVHAEAFSDEHIGSLSADLERAAAHVISANDDLATFRAGIAKDKRLAGLVDALPGYKVMRGPDLWTMMLSSLVAQQISGAAARSIRNKLARMYGHVINVDGEDVPVLPAPSVMVELSEAQLREAGFSAKKAEYGKGVAQALLDGTIVQSELKQMSADAMITKLSSLKG